MSDLIETIRNNFMAFGLKSFATINSNQKLDHNPYLNVLAFELDKVRLGMTRRLIISMPPRHGKTFFGSICLPAWLLAHNPSMRIMIVTYGADLAEEIVPRIRTIMRSSWYRQVSRARLSKKQAVDLETTAGGRVFAVSIEGAVTGRGADVIITDDLLQQKDCDNYVKLERVNDLFENTIRTRLNNPKKGSIVVIAHRLNKDDLPGHLLQEGGWKHLKLALIAPRSRAYDIEDGKKWHRKKGELLRPGAFSRRDIQKLRASCKIFELLYQQNSKADERLRITPEHFPRFTGSPVTFANAPVVISIDPGQKHGPTASFSVIQVFSPWNERYFLRDQWRQQACWSDLLAACKKLICRYRPGTVLIEDTGMGPSLIDVLDIPHVDLVRIKQPHVDKVERLRPHRRTIRNGLIELPAGADWLDDFLDEITLFPHAPDTDQVDATTQFLTWIKAYPHPKVRPPPTNVVAIGSQGPLSPAPNEHETMQIPGAVLVRRRYRGL